MVQLASKVWTKLLFQEVSGSSLAKRNNKIAINCTKNLSKNVCVIDYVEQVRTISDALGIKTRKLHLVIFSWSLAVHRLSTDVVLILCPRPLDRTLKVALDQSKLVHIFPVFLFCHRKLIKNIKSCHCQKVFFVKCMSNSDVARLIVTTCRTSGHFSSFQHLTFFDYLFSEVPLYKGQLP